MGMALAAGYKSRPPIRAADMAASETRRRSNVLPFGRVWLWGIARDQQSSGLRERSQPFT